MLLELHRFAATSGYFRHDYLISARSRHCYDSKSYDSSKMADSSSKHVGTKDDVWNDGTYLVHPDRLCYYLLPSVEHRVLHGYMGRIYV